MTYNVFGGMLNLAQSNLGIQSMIKTSICFVSHHKYCSRCGFETLMSVCHCLLHRGLIADLSLFKTC